jgi:hypothetical protein
MRPRILFVAALTALAIALPAQALGPGSHVPVGMGRSSCAAYLELKGSAQEERFQDWLAGYLTALNAEVARTGDVLTGKDMLWVATWVGQYCTQNPGVPFSYASIALGRFLAPQR